MSNDGTFQKVGESDERMFGPRKVLVCGYDPDTRARILDMLAQNGLEDLPVVFAETEHKTRTLGELMELPDRSGKDAESVLPWAIILSGLTERELHTVLKNYRPLGLPSPLWATLTETSVNWPLKTLLMELMAEREALRKQNQQ